MASTAERIRQVITEVLGPLVRADGGELFVVQADERFVALHLAGRFAGCPGNTLVRRHVLEPALLAVAPDVRVSITSGALIPAGAERV